jgi:hypothetical protein
MVMKLPTAAGLRCSKGFVPLQGTCGVPNSDVSEANCRFVVWKLKIGE